MRSYRDYLDRQGVPDGPWVLTPLDRASADTHPQGGDAVAAPFMSGAVGAEGAETPNPSKEQPQ